MTPVPSHAEALEWDEGNERELAGAWHRAGGGARGVGQPADLGAERPPQVRRLEDVRHDLQLGRLTIVVPYPADRGAIRPITGWDTTRGERSRYFKGA